MCFHFIYYYNLSCSEVKLFFAYTESALCVWHAAPV